jgi:hypothetical protein
MASVVVVVCGKSEDVVADVMCSELLIKQLFD